MSGDFASALGGRIYQRLDRVLLAVSALMLVFAVAAQPDLSLLTGFWAIQISEAGLITDPVTTGGVGAALLSGASCCCWAPCWCGN